MVAATHKFIRVVTRSGQVPGVILCTRYWRDDLVGLFSGMAIGYFMLVLLYSAIVLTSNWQHYADLAVERAEMK